MSSLLRKAELKKVMSKVFLKNIIIKEIPKQPFVEFEAAAFHPETADFCI